MRGSVLPVCARPSSAPVIETRTVGRRPRIIPWRLLPRGVLAPPSARELVPRSRCGGLHAARREDGCVAALFSAFALQFAQPGFHGGDSLLQLLRFPVLREPGLSGPIPTKPTAAVAAPAPAEATATAIAAAASLGHRGGNPPADTDLCRAQPGRSQTGLSYPSLASSVPFVFSEVASTASSPETS